MADSSNNEKTVVSLYHLVLLTLGAATALFFLLLAMAPDGLQRELFMVRLLPVMLLTNLATQIISKDFQLLCKNKNGKNENDAGQDTE